MSNLDLADAVATDTETVRRQKQTDVDNATTVAGIEAITWG